MYDRLYRMPDIDSSIAVLEQARRLREDRDWLREDRDRLRKKLNLAYTALEKILTILENKMGDGDMPHEEEQLLFREAKAALSGRDVA